MSSKSPEVVSEALQSKDDQLSLKQPAWQVIVLNVLTFNLYFVYWCYKNWRDLTKQVDAKDMSTADQQAVAQSVHAEELLHKPDNQILTAGSEANAVNDSPTLLQSLSPAHLSSFKQASPMLRTIFAMVPFVQSYMLYTLAVGVTRLQPAGSQVASHPVLYALAATFAWITLSWLGMLPEPLHLTGLLSAIPVAIIQHWINRYWDSVETPGLITRHGFTFMELVTVIIGALALGFVGSGILIKMGR
ncbi:MAG: hypothetical protein K2X81_25400 [Candidatus Obscuribacterales bacterium]|nr:hypothetical protein [Candidatus Obscuribacterales bacterium]